MLGWFMRDNPNLKWMMTETCKWGFCSTWSPWKGFILKAFTKKVADFSKNWDYTKKNYGVSYLGVALSMFCCQFYPRLFSMQGAYTRELGWQWLDVCCNWIKIWYITRHEVSLKGMQASVHGFGSHHGIPFPRLDRRYNWQEDMVKPPMCPIAIFSPLAIYRFGIMGSKSVLFVRYLVK